MEYLIILGVLPFCTLLFLTYIAINAFYCVKEAENYGTRKNKIRLKHVLKGLGLAILILFIHGVIILGIKGGLW